MSTVLVLKPNLIWAPLKLYFPLIGPIEAPINENTHCFGSENAQNCPIVLPSQTRDSYKACILSRGIFRNEISTWILEKRIKSLKWFGLMCRVEVRAWIGQFYRTTFNSLIAADLSLKISLKAFSHDSNEKSPNEHGLSLHLRLPTALYPNPQHDLWD